MATPNSTEFHNAFANAFRACESTAAVAAQTDNLRRLISEQSGEEWARRIEMCRAATRMLFEAQKALDGARTKLKDAWDQEYPFPNPV